MLNIALEQNSGIFNSQKESNMAHTLKDTKVVNSVEDKNLSGAKPLKTEAAKTPEATILNFDKTKSFNRFLEASCDCC